MAVSLDEYRKLKEKVEERKTRASRAEGAWEEAMKRLREVGCSSIEGAEEMLVQLKTEQDAAERAYEEELRKFKEKWGNKLE